MTSTPATVYLSIGSNVGDRLDHVRKACQRLQAAGFPLRRISAVYETEPVDVLEQDWFLNLAVETETALPPLELLDRMHDIERELGRIRERPKGPRTIDIDILLYGDATLASDRLTLPHPRMLDRRFVLEPLREIAAGRRIPPSNRTVEKLYAELQDPAQVRRYGSLDLPVTA